MMRPTAIKVKIKEDYILEITFDNGEVKMFDVKPYIKGDWYGELSNKQYFASVTADGVTIAWPHGQDLCPDEIYYGAK